MTRRISLLANEQPVSLDYFVEGFVDHTVGGMLEALEGTGTIRELAITIEGDEIAINLNGATLPVNRFVSKIMRNTIFAMVSSLKGTAGANRIKIDIVR